MDWITLPEACAFLEISRPTLNKYRAEHKLKEAKFGGTIHLSKTELIQKIILPAGSFKKPHSLTLQSHSRIEALLPLPGVYDLRKVREIDAYGVMALLCSIKYHLRVEATNQVHLLLDGSPVCSYLESIGFFTEVERTHVGRVFCNFEVLKKRAQTKIGIILPLHLIGYRGAEKKILDALYDPLFKQGFSSDYCGYIGWIIGELCDNAHTHSQGPCYLVIEGTESSSTATRCLSIAVGDIGIGISESLKQNPKYAALENARLLPLAFQSEVSRMEVEPKRGKGLNDIVAISKGNASWFRIESGDLGMAFDFRNNLDRIEFIPTAAKMPGTRFCLILNDGEFNACSRTEINEMMQRFMEKN